MNTSACGGGSIRVSRSNAARNRATVSIAPYCRASPARRCVSLTWAMTWVGGASWPSWITRRAYGGSTARPARRTARWGQRVLDPSREATMDKAVLNSMTDAERRLVAQTEPAVLAPLDEDELLDLLSRIRRARTQVREELPQGGGREGGLTVLPRDGVRREPAQPRQGRDLRARAGPGQQAGRAGGRAVGGRAQGRTARRGAGLGSRPHPRQGALRIAADVHPGGSEAWGDQDHGRHQEGRVEPGAGRSPAGTTGLSLTAPRAGR